jgi:lysophospholipase L1-like esterase
VKFFNGKALALLLGLSCLSDGTLPSAQQSSTLGTTTNCYSGDWPMVSRFAVENALLLKKPHLGPRVVFLGDSITEHWILEHASFFSSRDYINRGIYAQTTPQLLLRFRPDVIALDPRVVVILAGTNDVAGNTGPENLAYIEGNLRSMVELGNANHIRAVLSSVLPVNDMYGPKTIRRNPMTIRQLNLWMQSYCSTGICVYLDYSSSMSDDDGLFRRSLTGDGLHPNSKGYDVMESLVTGAIGRALSK